MQHTVAQRCEKSLRIERLNVFSVSKAGERSKHRSEGVTGFHRAVLVKLRFSLRARSPGTVYKLQRFPLM